MAFTAEDAPAGPAGEATDPGADRWLDAVLRGADLPATAVVIGAFEDDVLAAMQRRTPGIRVIALEPDQEVPVLEPGSAAHRLQADGRLRVLRGPGYAGASDAWRLFDGTPGTPALLPNPAVFRRNPDATREAISTAKAILRGYAGNTEARARLGARYLRQSLMAVPRLISEGDCGRLRGRLAGVPAVVVGAGPSLDRTAAILRALRNRCVVIVVDTAARPLLHHGVTPDVVVSIDPTAPNARHLTNLPGLDTAWLVAEPSLHPAALAGFAGRTFFGRVGGYHPWPWLRAHGVDRHTLTVWSSVLTAALDVALLMGHDPVLLVGADLSYGDDQVYCRHTVYEEDWAQSTGRGEPLGDLWRRIIERQQPLLVPGPGAAGIKSNPAMVSARDWLVERVRGVVDQRVINCSGAGLLITPDIAQSTLEDELGASAPITSDIQALLREAHGDADRPTGALVEVARSFVAATMTCGDDELAPAWAAATDTRGAGARAFRAPSTGQARRHQPSVLRSFDVIPRRGIALVVGEFASLVARVLARVRADVRVVQVPAEGVEGEHHRLADHLELASLPNTFDVAFVASAYGHDLVEAMASLAPLVVIPKQAINLLNTLVRPLPWVTHGHRLFPSAVDAEADPRFAAALAAMTDDVERVKLAVLSCDAGAHGSLLDRLAETAGTDALRDQVIDDLLQTAVDASQGLFVSGLDLDTVATAVAGGYGAGTWLLGVMGKLGASSRVFGFDPDRAALVHGEALQYLESDSRLHLSVRPLWNRRTEALLRPGAEHCEVQEYHGADASRVRDGHYVSSHTETVDAFVERHGLGGIDLLLLDIGGTELRALQGAAVTLSGSRPQLAVAIYHSRDAHVDVPVFLHGLLPGYRFRVANHTGFRPGQKTLIYGAPARQPAPAAPSAVIEGEAR